MDFCRHCNVSAFQHTVYICHSFPAEKQSSSDFMTTVTILSDFGAQEEEICSLVPLHFLSLTLVSSAYLKFQVSPAYLDSSL